MTPSCRKVKYKERRSSKAVVKIKKNPDPPSISSESPASISEVSQQFFNDGKEEYEETKPIVNPIVCLRKWVQKQRFIPQDLSDEFLMFFLSASGYDFELTVNKLQKYFLSRQEPSPLFRDRDPLSPANVEIFKKLYAFPVPDTTEDGRKIIITGLVEPTQNYNQIDHLKALAMVIDLLIWEKDFGFGDYVIVFDGTGFQCPQLLENKVYNHRSIKSLLLEAIPGTLRSFFLLYPPSHVVNVADNRNGIWITVIKSKQEMISHLPADVLPLEYGGNLGHIADLSEQWDLHMVQSRNFFIHFERKMIKDYRRRLHFEQILTKGEKNRAQDIKLEADESEYKIEYYEKMRKLERMKHPGFGSLRKKQIETKRSSEKFNNKCWKQAKEEEEAAKVFEEIPLNNGHAKEIRKAQLEAERDKTFPFCASILNISYY